MENDNLKELFEFLNRSMSGMRMSTYQSVLKAVVEFQIKEYKRGYEDGKNDWKDLYRPYNKTKS